MIEELNQLKANEQYKEVISQSIGNNIVAIIGVTGSGKSTCVNYLAGAELSQNENGEMDLVNPSDPLFSPIKGGTCSVTIFPKLIRFKNLNFIDFPGLHDSRGTITQLFIGNSFKQVMEKASSIKMILVIEAESITSKRITDFYENLELFAQFINDQEAFSTCLLLINKSTKFTPNQIRKLVGEEGGVLKEFFDSKRIFYLSHGLSNPEERISLLSTLDQDKGKKVSSLKISHVYDSNEVENISNLFKQITDDFIQQIVIYWDNKIQHEKNQNNSSNNTKKILDEMDLFNCEKEYKQKLKEQNEEAEFAQYICDQLGDVGESLNQENIKTIQKNLKTKQDEVKIRHLILYKRELKKKMYIYGGLSLGFGICTLGLSSGVTLAAASAEIVKTSLLRQFGARLTAVALTKSGFFSIAGTLLSGGKTCSIIQKQSKLP